MTYVSIYIGDIQFVGNLLKLVNIFANDDHFSKVFFECRTKSHLSIVL